MDKNIKTDFNKNNSGYVPRVSICIPAYESYEGIIRLLISINKQKFDDYEVIISDDSKSDNVLKALNDAIFICGDDFGKKIRYERNTPSLNVPDNWNNSISLARGEYIKIMHHDDWFLDEKSLGAYVRLMDDNSGCSMAFSGSYDTPVEGAAAFSIYDKNFYENIKHYTKEKGLNRRIEDKYIGSFRKNRYYIINNNFIGAPSVTIIRRSFIEKNDIKYDKNLRWLVDIDYYMQVFQKNGEYSFINEPLIGVGLNNGQLTNELVYNEEVNSFEYRYLGTKYCLSENQSFKTAAADALIRCGASLETIEGFGLSKEEAISRCRAYDFRKTKAAVKADIKNIFRYIAGSPRNCYRYLRSLLREYNFFITSVKNYGKIRKLTGTGSFFLCFDHKYGGGAAKYLREKAEYGDYKDKNLIVIRTTDSQRYFEICCRYRNEWTTGYIRGFKRVKTMLSELKPEHILVSEIFEYPELPGFLQFLAGLKHNNSCAVTFCLHDYYCICPVSNLVTKNNKYCGLNISCDQCMKENSIYEKYCGIKEWRFEWHKFLKQCDEIVSFSNDTKSRILTIYPDINITIQPHKMYSSLRRVNVSKEKKNMLTAGILGSITAIKGLEIIRQMVDLVSLKDYPIRFVIIGEVAGKPISESDHFHQTGKYIEKELPDITEKEGIDAFIIPSVWPETFSYTTKEAMEMGLPVFCFNIGAQQEWASDYHAGYVIDRIDPRSAVERLLVFLNDREE